MRNRFLSGLIPALVLAALPAISSAGVFIGVSVNLEPPPLPVYVQPPCPEPGYIWTPGYWAWDDGAYYWVPGTWVLPPMVGLLWTPGYWGWGGGVYYWHAGYWGPHVGFYGGVHYGFGYDGEGFNGGYWRGGRFFYNRAVVHVGQNFVTNVYSHPVVYRGRYEHVSFNGGPGGVEAHASRQQVMAEHEHHVAFTPVQQRQQRMAFADRSLRADYNHGRPPIAATARPAVFHGGGTYAARAAGGPMHFNSSHDGASSRGSAPMRSDRPSWATGQNGSGYAMNRSMEHSAPAPQQRSFGRPEQQHFESRPQQQRFESRPQQHFQSQPQQRHFESAPQQQHFEPRQQMQSRPSFRSAPRPEARGPAARPAPHPQQRGGEHRPPEDRGHNR